MRATRARVGKAGAWRRAAPSYSQMRLGSEPVNWLVLTCARACGAEVGAQPWQHALAARHQHQHHNKQLAAMKAARHKGGAEAAGRALSILPLLSDESLRTMTIASPFASIAMSAHVLLVCMCLCASVFCNLGDSLCASHTPARMQRTYSESKEKKADTRTRKSSRCAAHR